MPKLEVRTLETKQLLLAIIIIQLQQNRLELKLYLIEIQFHKLSYIVVKQGDNCFRGEFRKL